MRQDPRGRSATTGEGFRFPWLLFAGIGLGVVGTWFLDPGDGALRRHVLRDRTGSAVRRGGHTVRNGLVNLRNRVGGRLIEARNRRRHQEVSEQQLVARVRAVLGHHLDHVHGVEVRCHDDVVTLRGHVPRAKMREVHRAVRRINGVNEVRNELLEREASGGQPALQR